MTTTVAPSQSTQATQERESRWFWSLILLLCLLLAGTCTLVSVFWALWYQSREAIPSTLLVTREADYGVDDPDEYYFAPLDMKIIEAALEDEEMFTRALNSEPKTAFIEVVAVVTNTPSATAEPTVEPTDTAEPTNTAEPTASSTSTPRPTVRPTNTVEPTDTTEPTNTAEPTASSTPRPTNTIRPTRTNTPFPTATNTPVPTASNTPVPPVVNTQPPPPTITPSSTATTSVFPPRPTTPPTGSTPTITPTPGTAATATSTSTFTPAAPTATLTPTPTNTPASTPTNTPTATIPPSFTPTSSPTATPTLTPTPTNTPTSQLLSQNQPAFSSSVRTNGFGADKAVDGSLGTAWASQDPAAGTEWLYVDLGSVATVTQVTIQWATAYAQGYQVQLSNDAVNWNTVYATSGGDGGADMVPISGSGRYVRMFATQLGGSSYYSIHEIEIYGSIP